MKRIYYLSTCSTSKRIIKEFNLEQAGFELQDIKFQTISESQLDEMKALAGSYEAIFSRLARKYKALGLKLKTLSELDYKNYILEDYTFLKRPVIIVNEQIFIGSGKPNLAKLKQYLAY